MAKIAPSVLGADFSRLGQEIADADRVGVDMFHLDIMDGHFVPNISFGPGVVATIDKLSTAFLDVHLMLSEPERYFEPFVEAGADSITFHIEVHPDPLPFLNQLTRLGIATGLSLNPDTAIDAVYPFLERADYLLIMSVFPGFGGQEFIPDALPRISAARRFVDSHHLKTQIQVDGGIDGGNARSVVQAGAHVLVMGTGFFGCDDRQTLVAKVKQLSYDPRP